MALEFSWTTVVLKQHGYLSFGDFLVMPAMPTGTMVRDGRVAVP